MEQTFERRSHHAAFHLTPSEAARLERAAALAGTSVSSFGRVAALARADETIRTAENPFVDEASA